MDNLTYQTYRDDPAVREQLELEIRRARARAMYLFIAAPLMRLLKRARPRQVLRARTA
jgi:hypothetical protein